MPEFVYRRITDSTRAGPLVAELTASDVADIARYWLAGQLDKITQAIVNQAVVRAEEGLPEGTRVELRIGDMYPTGGGTPESLAQQINVWYIEGRFRDPASGELLAAWPEYPYQIAWGDSSAGTVTLRWVKGIVWYGWLLIALLVVVGIWGFYNYYLRLRQASWGMDQVVPKGAAPTPPSTFLDWLLSYRLLGVPLALWVGGAAALAVAPWAIRRIAALKRAERELKEAQAG